MLGISDAWLMSHLSHRPSDQAYYIEIVGFMVNSVLYPLIICYEQQCIYILISWCIADEELLKMVQDVSEDPVYHTIEFNEFLQLLSKQQRSGTTRDSLTDAFRFVSHFWPRTLSYFLTASFVSFLTASCNSFCNYCQSNSVPEWPGIL